MRILALLAVLTLLAGCVGEVDTNGSNNGANNGGSADFGPSDSGDSPLDQGTQTGDTGSQGDTGSVADTGFEDMQADLASADMGADLTIADMNMPRDMQVFTCVDEDNDGYFIDCADYQTRQGPDCNDADTNNWASCSTCADGDSDTYFAGCDRYDTILGPDCNDGNATFFPGAVWYADTDADGYGDPNNTQTACAQPNGYLADATDCSDTDTNNWSACATCLDADNDTYFTNCDRYQTINGPDCADDDTNNWASCSTCADADTDTYYVGCDRYLTIYGPDCNDTDVNNWTTCNGCVDTDGDTWFVGCNSYTGINGPDCSDSDTNNWVSCSTCVDADNDNYFTSCDRYQSILGADCSDSDANNWLSCNTCVDGDNDTYYTGCDSYGMSTEDCNDARTAQNPGATEIPNNSIDDDCDSSTPDAVCSYVPVPATNPESPILAGITAQHNYWRWRVGVAPLTWNATLAASAQAYANQCVWAHDSGRSPDAGFSYVGENLYASSQTATNARVVGSVNSWASERADYDYGDVIVNGGPTVGHYTQMVWHNSTDLGCAYAYCNNPSGLPWANATIVVCRYGPGGNYLGQAPYSNATGMCLDLDNDDVLQGDDANDLDRTIQ